MFPESGWIISLQGDDPDLPNFPTADGVENFGERSYGATLGVGRYLNASTSLELFAGYSEQESGTRQTFDCDLFGAIPDCDRVEVESENDLEQFSVLGQFRRVGKIGSEIFSSTARIGYLRGRNRFTDSGLVAIGNDMNPLPFFGDQESRTSFTTDQWNLLLAGSWFPTSELGLDLEYSYNFGDVVDTHNVGAGFGWFVVPNLEVRGSYNITFFENDFSDIRQWRATLRARF